MRYAEATKRAHFDSVCTPAYVSLFVSCYFRYREAGVSDWSTIPVTPPGSTQVTINRLSSSTTYEFQVVGKNALGDGMLSKVITVRTLGECIRFLI
jgi:hypothetical protein